MEKENIAEDSVDVDVTGLEKDLEALQIQQTPPTKKKDVSREKGRLKEVQHDRNGAEPEKKTVLADRALDQDLGVLSINDAVQEEVIVRSKPGRPRKVLETRDTNVAKDADRKATTKGSKQKRLGSKDEGFGTKTCEPARKSTSKSVFSQHQSRTTILEPTPELDQPSSIYVSPLLSLSDRKKVLKFEDWSAEMQPHFEITKIAEASFSEVYRLSSISQTTGIKEESVLKLVALKTPPDAPLPCQTQTRASRNCATQIEKEEAERESKDQWKSHVADVLSEIRLLQNLNYIPGFTVFRDLTVVQGQPSTAFSDAWKKWNKSRPRGKKSEFPDPSKKTSYDKKQLWAVIEMQDAGIDCEKMLEHGSLSSIWEVWDVFWGVCLSVAKAEEACRFEHRDLHLGNICVRSSRPGCDLSQPQIHDPLRRKLHFTHLETTVIDYTLSRADVVASPSRQSSTTVSTSVFAASLDAKPCEIDVAYLDLDKDPALFEGDASEEYQYAIYRYMRGAVLHNNLLQSTVEPAQEAPTTPRRSPRKNTHIRFSSGDEEVAVEPRRSPRKNAADVTREDKTSDNVDVWRHFHPKTNLVWAHFLLHKLLNHLQYHNTTPDKCSVKQITQNVTTETAKDGTKIKKKAAKLYTILQRVSELLCPVALSREGGLESMKELVILSLEERWLRVSDVAG